MIRRWQPLIRSSIAILMLLSLSIVFVHWHEDRSGQDCGLCYAHQMPGLQSAAEPLVAIPRITERLLAVPEAVSESSAFVLSHSGRAPPLSLS